MNKKPEETVAADTGDQAEETVVTDAKVEDAVHVSVDDAAVEKVIRNNVYAAMGVGLVPIPLLDFAAVTAIQLKLVRQLSNLYGVEFKEGRAKKIITAVISSSVPALGSAALGGAVIGIPLVGFPLAVGSQSILSGLSTYATGQMFVTHFKRGDGFINANIDALKEDFSVAYQNGRQWLGNTISGQKNSAGTEAAM